MTLINAAQFHLALNHFPVVLIVTSLPFLFWSVLKRTESGQRTGLTLVMLAALLSIPVFLSGEPTEDLLEKSGLSKTLMHDHEEAAEAGFIALLVAGGLAVSSWISMVKRVKKTRPVLVLCLVVSLLSTVLLARAAHLGGSIHHEEIRTY